MSLLVDACIARVREAARLDDDAVLPPLPVRVPRRDVVILTKSDIAGRASAIAMAGTVGMDSGGPVAGAGDALRCRELATPAQRVSRPSDARGARVAIMLCAFIAGGFASMAFLASPAAHRPGVERVTHAARAHVGHAADATIHAASSLFTR